MQNRGDKGLFFCLSSQDKGGPSPVETSKRLCMCVMWLLHACTWICCNAIFLFIYTYISHTYITMYILVHFSCIYHTIYYYISHVCAIFCFVCVHFLHLSYICYYVYITASHIYIYILSMYIMLHFSYIH